VIRIIVADDHALVRAGLQQWLSSVADFEVVGLAADGREAVEMAGERLPDVVLMDLSMPVLDGVEATRQIVTGANGVAVIALTGSDDAHLVDAALAAGAMGYLLKDVEPEVLASSIRAVVQGGLALSPAVAVKLFKATNTPAGGVGSLTEREIEVLQLIAAGKANKQIGRALGISEKTVKGHCGRIFQRLGVSGRTEAAMWALRTIPAAPGQT
jgi:DNA-binding NarL/FixJ family response regulator